MGCPRMSFDIRIERKALKFINSQPLEQKRRIFSAIGKLPNEGDRKKLAGADDLYRLRVGGYRIIYTVDCGQLVVCVVDAGNRGDVYK